MPAVAQNQECNSTSVVSFQHFQDRQQLFWPKVLVFSEVTTGDTFLKGWHCLSLCRPDWLIVLQMETRQPCVPKILLTVKRKSVFMFIFCYFPSLFEEFLDSYFKEESPHRLSVLLQEPVSWASDRADSWVQLRSGQISTTNKTLQVFGGLDLGRLVWVWLLCFHQC